MEPHKCKLIKMELGEHLTSSISQATCTGQQIQSRLPAWKAPLGSAGPEVQKVAHRREILEVEVEES